MALKPQSSPASPTGNSSFPVYALAILVFFALAGTALWWFVLRTPPEPPEPPPLTEEAREYVRNGYLALSGVEMKAAENYMMTTLVEITGNITNKGPRPIAVVELNCIFYDPYGQPVLRERVPIVRRVKGKPFQPGETRPFRLPFDNIPSGWNQVLPQLVIARIDFEN
ncbi:MAG: hypothetical protein KatS3mg005_0801 [Bryobacteraceae bacterium]|nr:MAG: hypothetical protein KatS3mg005_0801 [Bryobacteraceae bacterium]